MTTERTPDLLSGKTIFRLGLGLVIFAAVMFFRYSVEQGWIEPPVRVALAGLAGMAMIVIGERLTLRRPAYGTLLQGGGSAVLYLTVFATHQRYELIDQTASFIGLAAVSALVVSLALRHSSQPLAIVGVLGALAAPSLIDGRLLAFGGDALYVGAVVTVGVSLFVRKEWALLYAATAVGATVATLVETVRLVLDRSTSIAVAGAPSPVEVTIDAAILTIGLWVMPTLAAVRRSSRAIEVSATIGTMTAPIISTVILFTAWYDTVERSGLMAIALGVAVTAATLGLLIRPFRPMLAETHLVPALVLPLIGWFAGIEPGATLLLVLGAQASAMTVAGVRIRHRYVAVGGVALLGLVMTAWVGMLLGSIDNRFDSTDAALGALLLMTAYTGFELRRGDHRVCSEAGLAALWLAGGGAVAWSFASLNGLSNGPGLVTAAWAILGASLVVAGKLRSEAAVRNTGIGLLLVAVGKLLLVDTVGVSGLVRMSLFAGIGVGLLLLGYWLGDGPHAEDTEPEPELVAAGD